MISKVARLRAKKGFTLIDAVVVIAIIGILVAMIIPSLTYDQKPALGKALAKDVYYTAQDVLSTIKITNDGAIATGSYVCFYAELDSLGRVIKGHTGVFDPSESNKANAYTTFDDLLSGTVTPEEKKMYEKMGSALEKYVTDKDGMNGFVYIVGDDEYRVRAVYWLNVDAFDLAVLIFKLKIPIFADRTELLGDLEALWQVRVEIVFTVELSVRSDAAICGKTDGDAVFNDFFIQLREHAGHTGTNRATVRIGFPAEFRCAGAENLRFCRKLGMDFQTDNHFIIFHSSPTSPMTAGIFSWKAVSR